MRNEQLQMKMWSTIEDAVQYLGISERTIYRRIETGKLKSKLQNGRRLVEIEIAHRDDEPASSPNKFILNLMEENEEMREQLIEAVEEMNAKLDTILGFLGQPTET